MIVRTEKFQLKKLFNNCNTDKNAPVKILSGRRRQLWLNNYSINSWKLVSKERRRKNFYLILYIHVCMKVCEEQGKR
jgi:hypothetical protein